MKDDYQDSFLLGGKKLSSYPPQPSAWDMQSTRSGSTQPTLGNQPQVVVGEDLSLKPRIDAIERTMGAMRDSLKRFFSIQTVPLHTLANSDWELGQTLFIAVEQRGEDDFVACLYDIDLYGYGDTVNFPEKVDTVKSKLLIS